MLTIALGLYYKLHGVHRPVAMKKHEIKRRKRVVPALPDQTHLFHTAHQQQQSPMFDSSVSPDPDRSPYPASTEQYRSHQVSDSMVDPSLQSLRTNPSIHEPNGQHNQQEGQPEKPRISYAPPPADFTNYFANTNSAPNPYPPSPGDGTARKRSISTVEVEGPGTYVHDQQSRDINRASSITSILNPAAQQEQTQTQIDSAIDPTLASISVTNRAGVAPVANMTALSSDSGQSGPAAAAAPEDKVERKKRLKEEAERMREMLSRMENELAQLDDD